MRWYEYKMEVDDLTAPDDLKAKLLAMTDTLTAEEKAEPMMAAPAPQTAAPAAPLNTEAKKKKPIHFPVKQLGTLAACLAVCVLGYSTLHLGIGMGNAKSSAPALYAAEGAADSSAASVAAGGFDLQHAALDSTPEAVNYSLDADDRSLETEYSGAGINTNLYHKIHLLIVVLHGKSFSFEVLFYHLIHLIISSFAGTITKWFDPEGLSSTSVPKMNSEIQTFIFKNSI